MFEIIMDWVIGPILDFLSHRHTSGKWHVSHLLPVVTIACAGIWWLGEHWGSMLLIVIGVVGTVIFGLANLISWLPRKIGDERDLRAYIAERKRKAEEEEKQKE